MSEAYAQVRTGKLKFKAKKKRKSGRGQESTHEQVDDTYLPEEPKEREGLEKPSGPLGSSKSKKSKQKSVLQLRPGFNNFDHGFLCMALVFFSCRKKRKSKRERETDKKLDHFERRKREKKIERGEDPDADEEVASDDSEAELNELLKNLTPAQRNFLKQKRKQVCIACMDLMKMYRKEPKITYSS